ncbi:MAG: EAL domain-containing protein, partial [Acetobacteraceae bacterium]|nr:EAL domain-containing protein [Acetobacteraceae bacterium]
RTTAEGVETVKQLAWLRNEGCTEVQGYFFSAPVPPGSVANVLNVWDRAALTHMALS